MKIDANLVSEISTSGVYTLILFLQKEATVTIGRLGKQKFPKGYYVYTGSALGKGSSNLKHRIARHLRKEKQLFWHIDYLLADENVSVETVVAAETNEDLECSLNSYLKNMEGAKIQVNGFGASDCRKNCGSHLLYFPEIKKPDFLVQKLVKHLSSSRGILSVITID
jgi:Uri superfamily endonuclease